MRKFERISEAEFEKVLKDKCDYEDIKLPERSTKHSAGYDFISPFDFELNPGETIKVPSGIKVCMNEDEYLAILVTARNILRPAAPTAATAATAAISS